MKFMLVAALSFALAQEKDENPLSSLREVAKELDRGVGEFLKGKNGADAFPAWEFKDRGSDKVRKGIAEAGIESATTLGFEIRLIFLKEGKAAHLFQVFVLVDSDRACLLATRSAEVTIDLQPKPLDEFKDKSRPFADAAKELRKGLEGDGWRKLPVADPDGIKKLIPEGKMRDDAIENVGKLKANLESAAKRVAELKPDDVRIFLDDEIFLAKDATGRAVGAIEGDFDSYPGRAVSFRLKGYKPFGR